MMRGFKYKQLRNKGIFAFIFGLIVAVTVLLIKPPLYYQIRSYLVMYPFSKYEEKNSLLEKQGITMKIPGGLSTEERDWYPFVMIFHDDIGFTQYMGRDLSLTILYNFGAFPWDSVSSDFFRAASPYYNSFYGGYLVKEKVQDKKYGFAENGNLNIKEIFSVPEYDYKFLVMESLGCPIDQLSMEMISYDIKENVQYAGYGDWIQIDSLLLVNRPDHAVKEDQRAYIQYGHPPNPNGEDFGLMTTYGRIYIRYAEAFQSTVFLYVLSPDIQTVEKCDAEILSKTTLLKSGE